MSTDARLFNDPNHWRRRAAEMRHLAQEMDDPESKQIVLKLAEEYGVLAKRAEQRLAGAPKAGRA